MYLKSIEIINFVTAGLWVLRWFPCVLCKYDLRAACTGSPRKITQVLTVFVMVFLQGYGFCLLEIDHLHIMVMFSSTTFASLFYLTSWERFVIKAVVLSLCEGFFVVCPNINIHQKELYFCIGKLEDFFPLFRLPLTSIGFDSWPRNVGQVGPKDNISQIWV